MLPCTQFLADPELEGSYDELLRAGDSRRGWCCRYAHPATLVCVWHPMSRMKAVSSSRRLSQPPAQHAERLDVLGAVTLDPGIQSCIEVLATIMHRVHNRAGSGWWQTVKLRAPFSARRGDCWLQDLRTLHRGTCSTSAAPRPELCLNYTRDFWALPANEITGVGAPTRAVLASSTATAHCYKYKAERGAGLHERPRPRPGAPGDANYRPGTMSRADFDALALSARVDEGERGRVRAANLRLTPRTDS